MLKIAITGGIACGKSALGAYVETVGLAVCDADNLVHRLLSEDKNIKNAVVSEFGESIVDEGNVIDRGKLAEIVFADKSRLDLLNSILHPCVIRLWEEWMKQQEDITEDIANPRVVCVVVPLLYELSLENAWDAVVCVAANSQICERRLKAKCVVEYERRLALQYSPWEKASRADYVVVNNGALICIAEQWDRIYISIMEKRNDK